MVVDKNKIGLAYSISSPSNIAPFIKNIAIEDSGANIHLENTAEPTIYPQKSKKTMNTRLPYGSTTVSTHVATFPLTGMSYEAKKIHILP